MVFLTVRLYGCWLRVNGISYIILLFLRCLLHCFSINLLSSSSRGRKIIIISNLCCLSERVVHRKDFGNDDFEEELNFGVAPQFIIVLAAPATKTVTNCNRLLFFFYPSMMVRRGIYSTAWEKSFPPYHPARFQSYSATLKY